MTSLNATLFLSTLVVFFSGSATGNTKEACRSFFDDIFAFSQ